MECPYMPNAQKDWRHGSWSPAGATVGCTPPGLFADSLGALSSGHQLFDC